MTIWSDTLSILVNQGWTQGESVDESGQMCLGRAICEAAPYDNEYIDNILLYREVEKYIDSGNDLTGWNDDPETTWSDVESLLKGLHEQEISKE